MSGRPLRTAGIVGSSQRAQQRASQSEQLVIVGQGNDGMGGRYCWFKSEWTFALFRAGLFEIKGRIRYACQACVHHLVDYTISTLSLRNSMFHNETCIPHFHINSLDSQGIYAYCMCGKPVAE
jgi:hypothetical protein